VGQGKNPDRAATAADRDTGDCQLLWGSDLGPLPCMSGAIHDGGGVWYRELPYTPERDWHALREADRAHESALA
jgi:hypothetical protein